MTEETEDGQVMRLTDILQNYWDAKKGDRPFPEENDISADELANIWQNCFLVEVVPGGKFRYEFLGDSIIEAYADDLEGEEIVEDLLYPESPEVTSKFVELTNLSEPQLYEGAFINKNNMDIKFRKLILPIGTNGKITHILGGMRWKAF